MVHVGDVHFDGLNRSAAARLLDAAERAGLPAEVVRTTSDGFVVPQAVADALGPQEGQEAEGDITASDTPDEQPEGEPDGDPEDEEKEGEPEGEPDDSEEEKPEPPAAKKPARSRRTRKS